MAFARTVVIDKLEIVEDGTLFVRRATYIEEDGARVTDAKFRRDTYEPGSTRIAGEPAWVRQIAAIVWTPAVIAAYQAKVLANANG